MSFRLISGVSVQDVSGVTKSYRPGKKKLLFSLSAEDYPKFFTESVKKLSEPVFFFIEIPGDNDGYLTYYLDNCTASVALAILKRYGGILYNDGVIRWGFGSHSSDDEIYMQEYQTAAIYSENLLPYKKVLESLGYLPDSGAVTVWDVISGKNPGECVNVESDDETYIELVNNLIDIGMHGEKSERR